MRLGPNREASAAFVLIALLLLGLASRAWRPTEVATSACCAALTDKQLDAPLPSQPKLQQGKLSNGLQYYIHENSWPKERVELRLVVNAGSVLETHEQRGLAHAVEHMLFRGTAKFPGRAVDSYLVSVGMRPGQDVNAYTGRDQTVYNITIPTERPGVLDTALAILSDMASAAVFDNAEARTEAGIVFEEWRASRDAGTRLTEQRNQLLLAGSKYAARDPIGDTAVLRKFDVAEMKRFYSDWYRPDLMALTVVGEIDAREVTKLVRKHFGKMRARSEVKPRPAISVPPATGIRVATFSDEEATGTSVALWFPRASRRFATVRDYQEWIVSELWQDLLNARLEDASDMPDSPLLGAGVDIRYPVRALEVNVVSAMIAEGQAVSAVDLLMTEATRLAQHGPSERELNLRAETFIKEQWRSTEWTPSSSSLADGYTNQYLNGHVGMTPQAEYDLTERIVPTITVADIQDFARRAISDRGTLLVVTQPSGHVPIAATDEQLIAQLKTASSRATNALADTLDTRSLVPELPPAGRVASEVFLRDIEVFDLRLSNGMRVLLKPTDFTSDDIVFAMVAPGGASLASVSDYPSAWVSDGVVENTGVGSLNGTRLTRLLRATTLDFSQGVSDDAIGFRGDLAPKDLELLFQLLHLKFTAVRADSAAFRRYRTRLLSDTKHRSVDPDAVFEDSAAAITREHDSRALRSSAAFLNAVSLPKALSFWNDRMANASGFTLVMAGEFSLTQVKPLLVRYLASLPAGVAEQPRDDGIRFPGAVVNKVIYAGAGPRAKTRIMLSGPVSYTLDNADALMAAGEAAELALGDRLREQLGGTYGVSVDSYVDMLPPHTFRVTIDFEASPDRIDSLAATAINELQRLSTRGPTNEEAEKVRAMATRDLDNSEESNGFWVNELLHFSRAAWPLDSIPKQQLRIRQFTAAKLREATAKFLSPAQHVRVSMFPKPRTPGR